MIFFRGTLVPTQPYIFHFQIYMTVTVLDHDHVTSSDIVASYTYSFVPSELIFDELLKEKTKGDAHSSSRQDLFLLALPDELLF